MKKSNISGYRHGYLNINYQLAINYYLIYSHMDIVEVSNDLFHVSKAMRGYVTRGFRHPEENQTGCSYLVSSLCLKQFINHASRKLPKNCTNQHLIESCPSVWQRSEKCRRYSPKKFDPRLCQFK